MTEIWCHNLVIKTGQVVDICRQFAVITWQMASIKLHYCLFQIVSVPSWLDCPLSFPLFVPLAFCSNCFRREWEDLHWDSAYNGEKVQWGQGDDPHAWEDHSDTGWDSSGPSGGGDHLAAEKTHWPGEAFSHWRSHTLSTGETDLWLIKNTSL